MQLNIHTTKDIKMSHAVEEKIQDEFTCIKTNISHADISLSLENDNNNHAKITINALHTQFHSDGTGSTLFSAIHDAINKLQKQIQKHKKSHQE